MKGRVAILDRVAGRNAAALMVDGRLEDLLVDPPEDATPGVGAIFRAKADRPMKGQGGLTLQLGDGLTGYLRRAGDVKPGQTLLVQVSGTAETGKAVPVTPDIVFKSRYVIVTPHAPGVNVSRAIRDDDERERLLEIAHGVLRDNDHGLILRSAAENVAEDAIASDIKAMCDLAAAALGDRDGPPEALVSEPDAHMLAWRDWADPHPDEVIEAEGAFETHGVLEAVDAALSAHVPLGAGASAFVEPTRALVAVDVNTGRDMSLAAGLKANMALARALPRVLRIKGLGGQITLDLAPMPKKDRRTFEGALRKAFRLDGADATLAGWTPLGHYELQKKRDRLPLSQVWPS